jgi:hypothetical protein
MQSRFASGVVLFVLVGCSDGASSVGQPDTLTRTISKEGGTIAVNGASLTIPKGALPEPVPISVEKTSQAVPKGFTAYSPVYAFRPSGLVFAKPASVTMQFAGDRQHAGMYWTGEGTFNRIGGGVSGNHVTASINHFSFGFVGTGSSPDVSAPMTDSGGGGTSDGDTSTPVVDGEVGVLDADAAAR